MPRLGVVAVFTLAVPASDGRAWVLLAILTLPWALSVLRRPGRGTRLARSPLVGLGVVARRIRRVPLSDGRRRGGVNPSRRRGPSAAVSTAVSSAVARAFSRIVVIATSVATGVATSIGVPIPGLGEVTLTIVRVPNSRGVDWVGLAAGSRDALADVGGWRSRDLNGECLGLLASDRDGVDLVVGHGDGASLASVLSLRQSGSCLILGDNVTLLVEKWEGIGAGCQSPGDKSCAHG